MNFKDNMGVYITSEVTLIWEHVPSSNCVGKTVGHKEMQSQNSLVSDTAVM